MKGNKNESAAADGPRNDAAEMANETTQFQSREYPTLKDVSRGEKKPRKLSPQQRWRKRNPKAYLAHLSVRNARRLGLIECQPCRVCGATKTEAHHPDYERPFDVVWLCRKHHKAVHAAEDSAHGS